MILTIVFFIKKVFGEFTARPLGSVANTENVCNDVANVYFLVHSELEKKINSLNRGHIKEAENPHDIHSMDLLDTITKVISKIIVEILSILNCSSMPFDEEKVFNTYNNREIKRTNFNFYYTI